MTAFKITNLTVAYDRRPVLRDISVEFPGGKLIGIVGPNGSGKTTLIKASLGLIPRVTGAIEAFGKPFDKADSRVGYVPQRESVDWDFPVSVLDIVLMGSYARVGWCRRPSREEVRKAEDALETMGIAPLKNRQISQLSGGQQQRAFLARALMQDADIYFMDEPFAAVDASTELAIVELLRTLRSEGKTVIAVHHDLHTVRDYFDEVLLLDGTLVGYGPVDEAFTRENLRKAYGGRLGILEHLAPEEVAAG